MFESLSTPCLVLALLVVVLLESTRHLARRRGGKNSLSFPPGPSSLPIVGNALEINSTAPWITYEKWGKTYGEIIHYRLFQQHVIVINSEQIARDLLEKRSYNYSDRPALLTTELLGWSLHSAGLMRYGNTWRQHRRFYHQSLRSSAALSYRPLQMRKIHELLVDMLEAPEDFVRHTETMAASIIISITYGYEAERRDDPLVSLVENVNDITMKAFTPEASAILTSWPFLLYLPSWFPGLNIKRVARGFPEMLNEMIEKPFQYTKTATTLIDFILAMVLYPKVQERAQAEIDSVVDKHRLPNFEDRSSLPYVEAVLRETHRWRPVVPLGLAHAAVNDDIYEGFHIPGGAVVIANAWTMSRNEVKYSNPSDFIPERFLSADNKLNDDTVPYAFGFGRRVCVGKHVADASVWASIVSLLAVFKFTKAKDNQGREINVEPHWTYGLTVRPASFACHIEPRSTGLDSKMLHQMISQFT
ncbi:hypothetical protein SERLADRAFT_472311 [Serpula lacrymans var. lacrymans S7.9]|uniref:Cytochrome P450 n=1 Tax=Serpula lacrymans var. lacrymans (strain S7.9) TaxID=578457 RepID=F8P2F1_SERL9|nr:uncharacterized protein SERLADRAFT_472311 [Serpula lacrymans var. lacrymans S7.9]EGO23329.1 hypothetical protein SERLADRAFT_472311 [Serpula lacrymans var. lacrymans S7.9]